MALLNFNYGLKAKLPSNIVNGNLYVTTDERGLYVDLDSKRIHISDFIELTNAEFADLKTAEQVVESAFYYTTDGNALYKWNGSGWNCLNDTSDLVTALNQKVAELNTRIDNVTNSVYTVTVNNGATLDQMVTAAGITSPKSGDVLVATIRTTYTENNVEKTCETKAAYGYTVKNDQGQWIAFDGNVNAENVIFTSDLTLTSDVGVHTMPSSGSKTLPTTGKSVKQVMGLLFAEEKNPSTSRPTFTFSATSNKSGEVGTYYSLPTATLKMTGAGSYTYGPATGVHVAVGDASVTASNVANAKTNTTKMVKDSTLAITAAPFTGATTNSSNQVQYTDTAATYSFTASAKYSDGATPVTNLGNSYAAGQIKGANVVDFGAAAGNQAGSASTTYTGFRSVFYGYKAGGSTLDVTKLTSAQIRNLGNNATTTKPSTMTTNKMQQMFFAFPAGSTSKVVVKDATNGAPQTVEGPVTVKVEGANGYTAVNYDVFYVSNAAAAAGELKFNITY